VITVRIRFTRFVRIFHQSTMSSRLVWFRGIRTASAMLLVLLWMPLGRADAQQPSFSGRWVVAPDSAATGAAGRGRGPIGNAGSGWGSPLTIAQDSARLVIEYPFFSRYDLQPPLRFVYALNGSATTNTVMLGHAAQTQISRVTWDGPVLVIRTTHVMPNPAGAGESLRVDVTRRLSLAAPARLVVETLRAGAPGGLPSTSRTVYTAQ
jgi:hypothetical protein